jgi:hypothetical protein
MDFLCCEKEKNGDEPITLGNVPHRQQGDNERESAGGQPSAEVLAT